METDKRRRYELNKKILEKLASLSPEQRALLEKRLLSKSTQDRGRQSIPAISRDKDAYSLSYTQFRMWWLDQVEPGNPAYIIPVAVRMNGKVDLRVLEQSLQTMVQRHESFRTTFHQEGDTPVQKLHATLKLPLHVLDLSSMGESEKREKAIEISRKELRRPFQLDELPLIRSSIIRLDQEEHLWIVAIHHIVFDGWSVGLFLEEIGQLYQSAIQKREFKLPEFNIQSIDYAEWEKKQLNEEQMQGQLTYWKDQMKGPLPVLDLPVDFPRPSNRSSNGKQINIMMSKEVHDSLQEVCRVEEVTLFTALMTAYIILLHRYSQQDDIIVGFPILGRGHSEVQQVIGAFVNTLPLRCQLTSEMTCREVLQQVKKLTMDAFTHQDIPFEMLIEEIQPERRASYNSLFQVMFNLNKPVPEMEMDGLSMKYELIDHHTSKFDLNLEVRLSDHGDFLCTFEYSTDLFKEETIQFFAEHYRKLLQSMSESIDGKIANMDMMTKRDQLKLTELNDTHKYYHLDAFLQDSFVQQAEMNPERIALFDQDKTMTYGELHERSNRVAHFLHEQGVGRNQLVAIMMERGIDLMVSLYGILKAGAAYVPIDPEYPVDRIEYMIHDSNSHVIISKHNYSNNISTFIKDDSHKMTVLFMDEEIHVVPSDIGIKTYSWSDLSTYSTQIPDVEGSPTDMAYMIYTSGSTGNPKGVPIQHSAIVNRLQWHQEQFQATSEDVIAQRTSICFDVSVWELFWALSYGAKLSIVPSEVVKDPERLYDHLIERNISIIHFVPSLFSTFISYLQDLEIRRAIPSLRWIVTSGEALPIKPVNQWFAMFFTQTKIANLYGPTEAAVDVTSYIIEGPVTHIPIGKPVANTQLFVLDHKMKPCPINVPGELYIGGVQLALGYYKQEEKTAESFIPNHLPYFSGERLYRTGDLARVKATGDIEYLGRKDNQVKLRGFRIELDEIETLLGLHPKVTQVAVVIRKLLDDQILLAFYTQSSKEVNGKELKDYLAQKVPGYMIPSHVIQLDEMPLTPSGKINRKLLKETQLTEFLHEREGRLTAPATVTEKEIVEIWKEILLHEQIGCDQNFFDLGGHSLMVTKIISRIRNQYGLDVSIRDFFENPTIREFARIVDNLKQSGVQEERNSISIPQAEKKEYYTLSNSQKRLYFVYQLDPESNSYNMPGCLHIRGELNICAFKQAFQLLISRHDILRTRFIEVDGTPMQDIKKEIDFTIQEHDLTVYAESERQKIMQDNMYVDQTQPFHLEEGPLLRAKLFVLNDIEYRFYLNMHHIISDGWSIGVMAKEICNLYEDLSKGNHPSLAECELQYVDYAEWQEKNLQNGRWFDQEEYWLRTLSGPLPELKLPYDKKRPLDQAVRGEVYPFVISEELAHQLRTFSQENQYTLFMVLFAAYAQVLYHQTGQRDFIIGVPIAGRSNQSLESLIGLFLNNLAIRLQIQPSFTQHDLLELVKKQSLDAFQNQIYPFDLLVEKINPERKLNQSPIFSTMFNLQNTPLEISLRNMDVSLELGITESIKYDMQLRMSEEDNRLIGHWCYCAESFEKETIEEMVHEFKIIVEQFVQTPDILLDELDLRSEKDHNLVASLGLFDSLE